MRFLLLFILSIAYITLCAQHEDGPFQLLPEGVELSEYRIRAPSGLTSVEAKIEPPNWWAGMQARELELLIYDRQIAEFTAATTDYPGVSVAYVQREANPNYLFVGLEISAGAKPGRFTIDLLSTAGVMKRVEYELLPHPRRVLPSKTELATSSVKKSRKRREATPPPPPPPYRHEPLNQGDLIYLIMPDRFANGDPGNDSVEGTRQTGVERAKFQFRHGGDLLGIMERLDYLEDLGVTALWLNPVLENDQPYASYHGYAVTDHYRIDPRLGTNEQYRQLVEMAHARGMKVIMDVIFNHVGDEHYQVRDLPSTDWIHQWPEYTQTTYRATTLMDPNASDYDRKRMTDGWFDKHMPDLNQQNPHLARYLIQNSIWWTAYSGQDAFRIDTYAYPDPDFMAEWNRRMLEEFPELGIYGETWVHGPAVQAWFVGSPTLHDFNTRLPGVTDFQLYYAINEAIAKEPGWTEGVMRLYYTLAQDYLYENPGRNVTFLDNHDLARFLTVVDGDMTKFKSGLALLLSLRGIPMLYYGTEVGLTGAGGGFGEGGRVDFPGGWPGDKTDLFTAAGRNGQAAEIHAFIKRLANFRKTSPALTEGELVQFVPREGMYVYFRRGGGQTVMVAFNGKSEAQSVDLAPYGELLGGFTGGTELVSNQKINLDQLPKLAGKETMVIVLE